MTYPKEVLQAYELAKEAQSRAHAPYSNFYVGSAVKMKGDDQLYVGCNVENASFGATVCAERNAINASVVAKGKQELEFLIVVCDTQEATPPCGICLQHLSEFATSKTPIYLANKSQIFKCLKYEEILPYCYDSFE